MDINQVYVTASHITSESGLRLAKLTDFYVTLEGNPYHNECNPYHRELLYIRLGCVVNGEKIHVASWKLVDSDNLQDGHNIIKYMSDLMHATEDYLITTVNTVLDRARNEGRECIHGRYMTDIFGGGN